MRSPSILLIALFLSVRSLLPAQNLPLLAVIPLRSLGGVSPEQANTVTSLLETSLVKSTMFQVVEKSEIAEVLAAQEHSAEEFMDETFAIRIGKLVSAGQIVLGTLSRLGNRYFITAKIIDVATGRTLKAENDESDSIESIARQAEALGYRLAGLQLEKGGRKPDIRFAELLITTEPDNAEVLLNGLPRGTSPLLVERVPLGPLRIAARKEGMYGDRELVLQREDLLKVKIVLNQRLGRLFVRASERDVFVKLDDEEWGFLGDGVISDIPEGEHTLELTGKGLYGRAQFRIAPGETKTLDVHLETVGSLHYRIPEGARAVISGGGFSKEVAGESILENIPVGAYTAATSHPNYSASRRGGPNHSGKDDGAVSRAPPHAGIPCRAGTGGAGAETQRTGRLQGGSAGETAARDRADPKAANRGPRSPRGRFRLRGGGSDFAGPVPQRGTAGGIVGDDLGRAGLELRYSRRQQRDFRAHAMARTA